MRSVIVASEVGVVACDRSYELCSIELREGEFAAVALQRGETTSEKGQRTVSGGGGASSSKQTSQAPSAEARKGGTPPGNANFFSESLHELKKITFPTRQETFQATIVTVLIVVFMAMCVFLVDLVFNGIMSAIVTPA